MAYEAYPANPHFTPDSLADELSSYYLDAAIAVNGLSSAGLQLQRMKTVIGADGLEYTELETFSY